MLQTNQHDKLDLYSDSSQKQQHEGRLVAPHITLIPSQTSLCSHALEEKQQILKISMGFISKVINQRRDKIQWQKRQKDK